MTVVPFPTTETASTSVSFADRLLAFVPGIELVPALSAALFLVGCIGELF